MNEENVKYIIKKRMEKAGKALEKNNMAVYYADTKENVPAIVKSLLKPGDIISCGGTMTAAQCGVMELIKSSEYQFIDRTAVPPEQIKEVYRKSFCADAYITSANAVTENGELYNVDGNSNRIAAIAYGPDSVIVIAGYNKLVKDLDEAIVRVKTIAAPTNTKRLDCATYCKEKGECMSFSSGDPAEMTAGCESDARICCNYLVSAHQRHKNRIKVILVAESLGY